MIQPVRGFLETFEVFELLSRTPETAASSTFLASERIMEGARVGVAPDGLGLVVVAGMNRPSGNGIDGTRIDAGVSYWFNYSTISVRENLSTRKKQHSHKSRT